ncbi:hypothetical protein LOD44_07475 [Xylella fastidiosa subsp. multiplex]|uniref:hypothetical protein n=1 Tax=Xylella fastidiosa TaxID=2371 RepID=UPI001E54C3D3|nr:hypothetical protein [Xylella fastidiosa]MDC6413298.1 hypothetical protein [Xylella fastidiosa subsp. multiplex]MDC6415028.1 hypothetical protein [Xylella fastidiosa subsp. multiplex]MDC6418259.1 hypothetical protein [Xylella fastidiosa subsp. multiplex]MDD0863931.1 hypothetical protein [Xylella fastidiosa subsp. multiplex]MDD0866048.1 hypothetical protein [Xylella fastidiosa subsp. multiplex]
MSGRVNLLDEVRMAVSENALSNYSSTISGFLPEVCFDQKAEHFERRYDSCALITFCMAESICSPNEQNSADYLFYFSLIKKLRRG